MSKKVQKEEMKKLAKELLIPRTSGCYQTDEKNNEKSK